MKRPKTLTELAKFDTEAERAVEFLRQIADELDRLNNTGVLWNHPPTDQEVADAGRRDADNVRIGLVAIAREARGRYIRLRRVSLAQSALAWALSMVDPERYAKSYRASGVLASRERLHAEGVNIKSWTPRQAAALVVR